MTTIVFITLLAACATAASSSMLFKPGEWYKSLNKPNWTPPNWAFPVAWTLLYLLIAYAGSRVAMIPGAGLAMAFWALQIGLNTQWTPVFFGARNPRAGLIVIVLLFLAIAGTCATMVPLDRVAALLMVPYLLWVGYATALNFAIWRANPALSASP